VKEKYDDTVIYTKIEFSVWSYIYLYIDMLILMNTRWKKYILLLLLYVISSTPLNKALWYGEVL